MSIKIKSNNIEEDYEVLVKQTASFLNNFIAVFHYDWDYAKELIEDSEFFCIAKEGTFLKPNVKDIENNWVLRKNLLDDYESLKNLLNAISYKVEIKDEIKNSS